MDFLRDQGGSIMGFLGQNYPAVMDGAMESASAAKDIGSAAAAGIASIDMHDLSVAADAVKGVANAAMSAVGHIDLGAVQDVAATVGHAVSNAIDTNMVMDVTTTVLNALGTTAAVFPFLLPLQIALRDIGTAVQMANYNREAAKMLQDRCTDCSKLIVEMAPKITKISASQAEQEAMVKPFVDAVNECTEFLKAFSNKGFLSKMFTWKKDDRRLSMLDKKVSDTLQNLSMRVDGKQIDLQVANAEKLDEVFNMLKKVSGDAVEPSKVDPEQLAEVLRKAGAESKELIAEELQGVGFKLDQIDAALKNIMTKFDAFGEKMDLYASEQKDRDAELRNLIIYGQEEARKTAEKLTLAAMRMMTDKGGQFVEEKSSTNQQVEYLAKRSKELRAKVPELVLVHPMGIGSTSVVSRDGPPGAPGPPGACFHPGRGGMPGTSPGADGEDGLDGEDGHDGQEGEDGGHGEDADDFEVMIEFISEDKKKGTRKYKVEHAGPNGKDEHEIEVSLLNSVILIDGKGGIGGRG
jgi:hypothetical protein